MKVTGSTRLPQQADETLIRIPLPFKDQRSANKLREQLSNLSRKINAEVHSVFTSRKIKDELKAKEPKPPSKISTMRRNFLPRLVLTLELKGGL